MVSFCALLCLGAPASAEAEPAKITADEVTLNFEAQQLIALGNAHLTYQDVAITADRIDLDLEKNTLVAKGHVNLTQQGQTLTADELAYDLNSEAGHLLGFKGQFGDAGIKGSLYLSGDEITHSADQTTANNISLTTCDRDEPHYHFTAGKVEYYPKDRLILRNVIYWEGHLPLFYLPYLAISLKDRANAFQFPQAGYSPDEGLFLKLVYNFYLGEDQSGQLLLDIMQYKGIGEGLKYAWDLTSGADLALTLYHLENWQTGGDDYRLTADLAAPLGAYRLQSRLSYEDQSKLTGPDAQDYRLGLKLSSLQGTGTPPFTLDYHVVDTNLDWWSLDVSANGTWTPWEKASLVLSGRWYWGENDPSYATFVNTGEIEKTKLEATFTQTFDWGKFTLYLLNDVRPGDFMNTQAALTQAFSWGTLGLNLQSNAPDPNHVVNTLPRVTLNVPSLDLGAFLGKYSLALDYLHLIQDTPELAGEGQRLAINLDHAPWKLIETGPFLLNAGLAFRGRFYDIGDSTGSMAPSLNLTTKLTDHLNFVTGLSWTTAYGGVPPALFLSDVFSDGFSFNLRGNLNAGAWQGSLTTGYTMATGLWNPVDFSLSWTTPSTDKMTFKTTYDIETDRFKTTSLVLDWKPLPDWAIQIQAGYDHIDKLFDPLNIMASIKQPLGDKFSVGLKARYDFFTENWVQSAISLDYVWHCRTLSLGYDWLQQSFTLAIAINAFPQYPVKFGYSESGLTFVPPFVLQ